MASTSRIAASESARAEAAILADKKGPDVDRLVVRRVAEPAEGFERQADPLEVGIGRRDKLQPGEGVHFVARGEREAPALQRAEHFV